MNELLLKVMFIALYVLLSTPPFFGVCGFLGKLHIGTLKRICRLLLHGGIGCEAGAMNHSFAVLRPKMVLILLGFT